MSKPDVLNLIDSITKGLDQLREGLQDQKLNDYGWDTFLRELSDLDATTYSLIDLLEAINNPRDNIDKDTRKDMTE